MTQINVLFNLRKTQLQQHFNDVQTFPMIQRNCGLNPRHFVKSRSCLMFGQIQIVRSLNPHSNSKSSCFFADQNSSNIQILIFPGQILSHFSWSSCHFGWNSRENCFGQICDPFGLDALPAPKLPVRGTGRDPRCLASNRPMAGEAVDLRWCL